MKKAFPIALVVLGLVFVGAGIYTVNRGFDARDQVRHELVARTSGELSVDALEALVDQARG